MVPVSILSKPFETAPSRCPYCDYLLDVATGFLNEGGPSPGDWTICMSCAQTLVFDDNMVVRKPRAGELEAMSAQNPGLKAKIEFMARAVRLVDRRPAWEKEEAERPLNRQQRRAQERQRRHKPVPRV